MKIFAQQHLFKHPWADVTAASWRKYPNDYSPQVMHVDVLDRYVDSDGVLQSQRLIACHQPIPAFIRQLLGTDATFYFLECSSVDAQNKVYQSHTQNITYQDMIWLDERLAYASQSDTTTLLNQEASVESVVGGFKKIKSLIEDFCIESCEDNASNGRLGLEQVMKRHD